MVSLSGGLLGLIVLGLAQAEHAVTVEEGPLYRTVGSHITVWCKVSGYQGSSTQEFQFFIRLPSDPVTPINIISTGDPQFSYAKYSGRVRSRDIYVERVSGDHAILHIVHLQDGDTGEYECHTPNTASTFHGTYSAQTNLTVIPNTLEVWMPGKAVETSEGSSVELTCQVSVVSAQHTHLSVSWLLLADQEEEILTLSRDFVLQPGGIFSHRDLRLDKLGETTYRLTMGALRLSDQGHIYCRGSEWIQDPSGVWTKISQKDSEKTSVKVAAVRGGDFEVKVETSAIALPPGSPLDVTCSVSTTSPSGEEFRVVWLLNDTMTAIWEPSGVSTFREEPGSSGAEPQLVMQRRDLSTWVLRISQLRIKDGGRYVCDVTEGRSKKRRTSQPASVEVKQPALPPPPSLSAVSSQLYEGDSLTLRCLVPSSSSSASLGWFRKAGSGDPTHIVSVRPDGRLLIGGDFRRRHDEALLLAEKTDSGLFTLRLRDVTQGDNGEYMCHHSEGRQDSEGTWRNVTTASNYVQVHIQSLGSALYVSLLTRNSQTPVGDTAVLFCNVKSNVSLAGRRLLWSWFFQPDPQGPLRSLVQGPGNGELIWGEYYPDFQKKTQISLNGNMFILRIHRAQRSQQSGSYQCKVTVLTTGVTTPAIFSNVVTIKVQLPDMKLRLDNAPHNLLVTPGEDEAVVTCRILDRTPGTTLSAVWMFLPLFSFSPMEIARLDLGGVASQDLSPQLRLHFAPGRSSEDTFFLRLLRPSPEDVGVYHCVVKEWIQEEAGHWTPLGETRSGDTQITLTPSDWTLKLLKKNVSSSVQQGADLVLPCSVEAGLSPSSLLSISWFQQGRDLPSRRLLFQSSREGVTEYKDRRLRLEVPRRGNYSLVVQSAGQEDGGRYFCRVEEWRLEEGEWKMAATDQSGFFQVTVIPSGSPSSICSSSSLFYFLSSSSVLFVILILAVMALAMWWCVRGRRSRRGRRGAQWSPINMLEMEKENGTEDRKTPNPI